MKMKMVAKGYTTHLITTLYTIGTLSYNAQSPDEAALVSAARNFGYVFKVLYDNRMCLLILLVYRLEHRLTSH